MSLLIYTDVIDYCSTHSPGRTRYDPFGEEGSHCVARPLSSQYVTTPNPHSIDGEEAKSSVDLGDARESCENEAVSEPGVSDGALSAVLVVFSLLILVCF